MIGGVTHHMLPYLSGVPHLHVNRPLEGEWNAGNRFSLRHKLLLVNYMRIKEI